MSAMEGPHVEEEVAKDPVLVVAKVAHHVRMDDLERTAEPKAP